jgi:hypothetical protein
MKYAVGMASIGISLIYEKWSVDLNVKVEGTKRDAHIMMIC